MSRSLLEDAFAHHVWATLRLIDACLQLSPQQLETTAPGTYGSGYGRDDTIGIRLAQALHHGTDHRSQICTALTTLGVEPPGIDVWDFGLQTGRVVEVPPTT